MFKFNYKSVQNMQCLVTQILLNNMLKFHSDMAKHMFKIGFLFEIQVHSSWFSIVLFEGQTYSVKNSLPFQ